MGIRLVEHYLQSMLLLLLTMFVVRFSTALSVSFAFCFSFSSLPIKIFIYVDFLLFGFYSFYRLEAIVHIEKR